MTSHARIPAIASLAALVFAAPAAADPAELIDVGGRLGLSAVGAFATERRIELAPSALPEDLRNAALERAMSDYVAMRNAHTGARAGAETFGALADAAVAGSVVMGNIPGVVISLSLKAAIDTGNRTLARVEEARAREYLAAIGDELAAAAGAEDFRALVGQPDLLAEAVRNAQGPLADLRRRANETNDPGLADTVADVLLDVANETAVAALEQTAVNAEGIAALEANLIDLTLTTRDGFRLVGDLLADHEDRLGGLEADVGALQDAVATLDDRVDRLGRNQDLIADFMLARMTPAERLRALEGGLIDDRIVCPNDRPDCDRAEIRGALIARYRAEAELQATFDSVRGVLNTAGAIKGILDDVGVELPTEVGQALNIGNAVFGAVTNFASGNILGGIAAITGLFGGDSDPAAERHAQLMNYLRDRFDNIDEQLAGLREGQQRILDGLVMVSEQIETMHRDLSSRLDVLDTRLFELSRQLRTVLWDGWSACNSVYSFAGAPNPTAGARPLFDPGSHLFSTLDARFAVIRERAPEVRLCRSMMIRAADAVSSSDAWDRHGWFLDLDRIDYATDPEQRERLRAALAQEGGAQDYRSLAEQHRDAIVAPSVTILLAWAQRNGVSAASLLHALATGPQDMEDVRALTDMLVPPDGATAWRHTCATGDPRRALLAEVLCAIGARESEALALRHLEAALNTGFMPEAAHYAVVMSQLIDLYSGETDRFVLSAEEIAQMTGESSGRGLVRSYLAIGNIAIAHDQRIHGGFTALVIADDIIAGRATEAHRALLAANAVLAENVATALLHRWRGTWTLAEGLTGPRFEDRYSQAVVHARSGAATALDPLAALFDRDRGFVLEGGIPVIALALPGGTVHLPLPGPRQLVEGQFVMPPDHAEVIAARDALLDRLMDYELGADPDLVLLLVLLN